jgi:ketosteroid isomerase-like protein
MSVNAVLDRHLETLARADLDGVMADYAEDAILCTPAGVARGHAQIRAAIEPFATKVMPPGSQIKVIQRVIEGELAYLAWSGESPRFRIPTGTDTYIIRGGKIVAQTFAAQIDRKG